MGNQRQVTGTRVEGFPSRRRVRWDFSKWKRRLAVPHRDGLKWPHFALVDLLV